MDNSLERVLKPLAQPLNLPKLNFQILRRTTATQAQNMESVKDIRGRTCGTRRADTPPRVHAGATRSVQEMVGSVYLMLARAKITVLAICQQNAPKSAFRSDAKLLEDLGGRSRIRTYDFHRVKVALYR